MALPVEINPLQLKTSGGYTVSKSLRFRSSASAYLNRTFGTPTSSTVYTWSGWVKRGALGATNYLFGASTTTNFGFNSSNNIVLTLAGTTAVTTTAVYRDPSAWYHVVYQQNGAAQTISINGVSAGTGTTANTVFNTAIAHQLGAANTTSYFDGYLAEVNFVDGQALTASSFGAYDTNGVWQPKKYSGTYGTNGFYLPFGTTTTTATLGNDSSGNGNTWTVNNVSLTAGTTYDSMTDSPTVSSASVSNYAVFNPLWQSRTNSPTNGNLDYAASSVGIGTIGMSSGSYYWEITSTGGTTTAALYSTTASSSIGVTIGLTYGFRFNATTGAFDYTTNGSSFTSIATGLTTGPYFPYVSTAASTTASFNAGQRPFSYSAPTGFNALNTYNLPTPTIANGASYMAATLWTGTGAAQSVLNSANNTIGTTFQPDFVWMKSRGATYVSNDHNLFDVLRGVNKALFTNITDAETTYTSRLNSFDSSGFTTGAQYNANNGTFVGWQWKANGAGLSNTNGSITSTVSANTTAGFSVVTYTGTGANATVGHGLGVAPSMIITKKRSSTSDWGVYHTSLTSAAYYLFLNTTAAQALGATYWNSTAPTSSVFSIGTADAVNISTATYVAYCWSAVAGYSAFGSYTGNASTDGTFVYTGFRPRWIMIKRTDSTSDWYIWDTSRDTYNVVAATLLADTAGAETSATSIDNLSNGFKCRSATVTNASGGTYIYAAFAENPFNSSRAR